VNPCLSGQPPCDVPIVSPAGDTLRDRRHDRGTRCACCRPCRSRGSCTSPTTRRNLPAHNIPPGLPQLSCANYVPNFRPVQSGHAGRRWRAACAA
jgi:hypothetical protein